MGHRRLITDEGTELFSPLIDVVFNALAGMFVIFVVYVTFIQPGQEEKLLQFLDRSLFKGVYFQDFSDQVPVIGGSGQRNFRILEGSLPAGLELDTLTGLIYGIPKSSGDPSTDQQEQEILLEASDTTATIEKRFRFRMHRTAIAYEAFMDSIRFRRQDSLLPSAQVNQPYEAILGVDGGIGPYRWTLLSGLLPDGLRLEEGLIKGVPRGNPGRYDFVVRLEDRPGGMVQTLDQGEGGDRELALTWNLHEQSQRFSLLLNPAPEQTEVQWLLPPGRQGEPYQGLLQISTGFADKEITHEILPPGLSFDKRRGKLSGRPLEAGQYTLRFRISGQHMEEKPIEVNLPILPRKPSFETTPISYVIDRGNSVNMLLPYRGAEEPVNWSLLGNTSLPQGLQLLNGRISGQARESGQFAIRLRLTDSYGASREVPLQIEVRESADALVLSTQALTPVLVGRPYRVDLSAAGADGKYSWQLTGALPRGLSFQNGQISGTARETGRFSVQISVSSVLTGENLSRTYILESLNEETRPLEILTEQIPPAIAGQPYQLTFAAQGGFGTYSWRFSGSLPTGFQFTDQGIAGQAVVPIDTIPRIIEAIVRDEAGQVASSGSLGFFIVGND